MSKQRQRPVEEDNRDIFEKALDAANDLGVPGMLGGAAVGGLVGRKYLSKAFRKGRSKAQAMSDGRNVGAVAGAATGLTGQMAYVHRSSNRKRK